jgi:hypothetical protein
MQSRQEWETPVPISVELKGVTYDGHYQLERRYSKHELRWIRVTYDGDWKPAHLSRSEPEILAKILLLELVGKQRDKD